MAHNPEDTLRTYIENVLKLQREREREALSDDDLKQIAFEAGMTADDLAYVQKKLGDYLNRGEGFIRYENWDGAIGELDQAIALAPNNVYALTLLATAHLKRATAERSSADRERAKLYAERALQIDSKNDLALQIVSAVQKDDEPPAAAPVQQQAKVQAARGNVRLTIISSAITALVGVGAAIWMTTSGSGPGPISIPVRETAPAPTTSAPAPPEAPEAPPPPGAERSAGLAREIMSFGREGIGPGMFTDARSLAIDGSGRVYVGEYSDGRVQVFDSLGKFLTQWSIGQGNYLKSLAADRNGTVYAVYDGMIHRYEGATGKLLGTVKYAKGPGFNDVTVTADGGLIASWNGHWRGGILVDPESLNDLVRFDASMRLVKTYKTPVTKASGRFEMESRVASNGLGAIYALGEYTRAVFIFDQNGKFHNRFGSTGNEPGQFQSPDAIAVDGRGRVYVADSRGILMFDGDGRYIGKIDHNGSGDALAISDSGEIYMVSRRKVVKFALNER